MSTADSIASYEHRKARVAEACARAGGATRIKKRSTSNLFRYSGRRNDRVRPIALSDFNHVLSLDEQAKTLEVEGLITYEQVVRFTLAHGLLPTVAPELKHITVGGAIVGIGIESSCFRYGFVHDGLLEADVLLPDGNIVTCRADNEYADLFSGLPNSYGTLGYILRARIALVPARAFVRVENRRCDSINVYIDSMERATRESDYDFVEGLFYSDAELYLSTSRMVQQAPETKDIYCDHIYYKLLRGDTTFYLPTFDYIFRYDPDWFWNVPEGGLYDFFRRFAPRSLRSSGFYNRYVATKNRVRRLFPGSHRRHDEQLIQDWEIPWEHAVEFTRFALDNVDIQGQPWVAVPIRTPRMPTNYPIRPDKLYFNVGCYCFTKKPDAEVDFYYTRILDRRCFELGGIKMLYSSTFLEREEFDRFYNGDGYAALKAKYDPARIAPTLFEKAVLGR
jgi:FAD/FMN-containing dehydrogenase